MIAKERRYVSGRALRYERAEYAGFTQESHCVRRGLIYMFARYLGVMTGKKSRHIERRAKDPKGILHHYRHEHYLLAFQKNIKADHWRYKT